MQAMVALVKGWSLFLNAKQTMIVDHKKNAIKELAYWHANWSLVGKMPNAFLNFIQPNVSVLEGIKEIPIVHAVKVDANMIEFSKAN